MRLDHFQSKAEAIAYIQENVYGCSQYKFAAMYLQEHLPRESYYQKKIMDFLKQNYPTAFVWKEAAGPYSRQGIPDVSAIIDGRYYGFEVKRPFFGVLSKIQEQTIEKIRAAGGVAEVVTFPHEVQEIVDEHL